MPNSLQSSAIGSPASRRATNCILSSIAEHSFQGIGFSSPLREKVSPVWPVRCGTYVSGRSKTAVKMPALGLLQVVIQNNMCYRSGIMSSNEKIISFRAVAEKIEALDSLATAQDRPRSYLINEAITNYIELHAYQDALVRKGLEEMRKGRVVSHEQVLKGLTRTGRARRL